MYYPIVQCDLKVKNQYLNKKSLKPIQNYHPE